MTPKRLTAKEWEAHRATLETIRRAMKAHYLALDADATLYDVLALETVSEALDGINHALDYMEPRK